MGDGRQAIDGKQAIGRSVSSGDQAVLADRTGPGQQEAPTFQDAAILLNPLRATPVLAKGPDHPQDADALRRGHAVITLEADALMRLARGLDATFAKACRLLAGTRGRIVVSGMGKSGHVGRKIAATLSATGSPAVYVNPAEAAHGDLGMIVPGDRLLVLSNSGNTPELRVLLDHARGHGIDIVGVTAEKTSLLAHRATVTILVPRVAEACPQGLAPTSSSTQQLALGDALAMALLDGRAGGGDKIGKLHPGGMIGLRRKRVGELMHGPQGLPLVHAAQAMESVISSMTSSGFGIAGVVDAAGQLLGTITDGDLRRHFAALGMLRAGDVMTASPRVLHVDMTAEEALAFLNHCRITCAFVMPAKPCAAPDLAGTGPANAGGKPLGVIHMHDFVRLGLS